MHSHRKHYYKFGGNNVFGHRTPEIVNPTYCTNLYLKCALSTRRRNFKYAESWWMDKSGAIFNEMVE